MIKKIPKTVPCEPPYAREDNSRKDPGLTPSIREAVFDKWAADTRFITLDISALSNPGRFPNFTGHVRALMASLEDGASSAQFRTSWKTILYNTAQLYAWKPSEVPVRRISLEPVADPLIRRCTRVIAMVHELHKAGYQRLRMVPMESPSGAYWRCVITYEENIEDDGYGIIQWDDERVAAYSSGQDAKYFNWDDSESLNARQLAQRFLERFPDIAERGRGRDWANAGWVADVLGEAEQGELVYLMADWTIDQAYLDRWRPPAPVRRAPAHSFSLSIEPETPNSEILDEPDTDHPRGPTFSSTDEKPSLNTPDAVNGIVKFFTSEILRKFAMVGSNMTLEDFTRLVQTESERLNFLFLGYGEGPDINFMRDTWNTPAQLGHFVRIAERVSGDTRTAVRDMFASLAADAVATFAHHHSDPVEIWGWQLDALNESVCSNLLGLPGDDEDLITASVDD